MTASVVGDAGAVLEGCGYGGVEEEQTHEKTSGQESH
jgi:hypothetical protein